MIAVKLHGQNPQNIPAAWPKETREGVSELPAGFDLLMTEEDYVAYRTTHQSDYDAWEAAQAALEPVPVSVSPWQIRRILNQLGLRASVESAVAASDQDTRDGWEYATEIRRDNALIAAMAAMLGLTPEQLDAAFVAAGKLA